MLGQDFLPTDRIRCKADASSRKDALQSLSTLLAAGSSELTATEIYGLLNERERLGSTCLGNGVAIPHGRNAGVTEAVGAMLLLREPVEFDANDARDVSVLLGLLLPAESDAQEVPLLARALKLPDSLVMLEKASSPGDAAAIVLSRCQAADQGDRED
ncbi:MAG: PTS sugar transporter subunit IIA [Gammaproteobacteria bacterium]